MNRGTIKMTTAQFAKMHLINKRTLRVRIYPHAEGIEHEYKRDQRIQSLKRLTVK